MAHLGQGLCGEPMAQKQRGPPKAKIRREGLLLTHGEVGCALLFEFG
eukprot:CAMPEP_0174360452 /NCGR_PEP_ID=MMETSP0811_2-20130205/54263_1 /TAXON_ID=73025 ORGANISM="Eutreptiella gymnastica-like, Strain CCMP1594" /NCGR_SAMPLE_ID=MMETSP0811_2 /ASSEMBLY_ACC=CAM_ASM_000667 /LENGTH=46 /DNA_ID= /DNA_START= /DNA_END= /DNA_ORIENTATION=